ncbi:MAG: DMT family transporter [Prevotella sp.]|nr:DMT family transporter [Prevotella sp.]MDY5667126.1 DMT family transporter [Alloprevotella sp.]
MQSSIKGHLSMLGANSMWGLMSPISKFIMLTGAVSPLVVTDLRITGAMILFWIASLFQKPEHVSHKDLARLFGAALLGIVLNQGCFLFGVSFTSPGDASIITTSMPLWAMVLAALILKEPITGKKVLGIAAGATGALMLILGSNSAKTSTMSASNYAIWGDLLVLSAQFCYAMYIVVYKDFVNKYSLVTIMKWMFTYSFICVLPFSYSDLMSAHWAALHATEIAGLAFVVVGATFLSYMLIVVGQKHLRPTVAGMYNYVQPIVSCLVAVLWGMDSFNIIKGIAVVFIFGGVYLVTISRSRKEVEAYEAEHKE